jgi:hypothetical protein
LAFADGTDPSGQKTNLRPEGTIQLANAEGLGINAAFGFRPEGTIQIAKAISLDIHLEMPVKRKMSRTLISQSVRRPMP